MSFGGAVSAMMTSLKNNKRTRVSAFNKLKGYDGIKYKKGRIEKKATPEQLKKIREKLQRENKKDLLITIIVIVSLLILSFVIFNYVKF